MSKLVWLEGKTINGDKVDVVVPWESIREIEMGHAGDSVITWSWGDERRYICMSRDMARVVASNWEDHLAEAKP